MKTNQARNEPFSKFGGKVFKRDLTIFYTKYKLKLRLIDIGFCITLRNTVQRS